MLFAGILAWAATTLDWARLGHVLRSANRTLVLVAAVANGAAIFVQAMRWRALLGPLARVRRRDAFGALALSFAFSSILPARLGELARLDQLARRAGLTRAQVAGSIVLDHVTNGVCFAPLLVPLAVAGAMPGWVRRGAEALLLIAACLSALAFRLAKRARAGGRQGRIARRIAEVREGFQAARHPRALVAALGWGLFAWLFEAATALVSLRAFHVPGGWAEALVVLCAVNLAVAAPSPPANLGTFELGAVLVLTALGTPTAKAAAFALGYHALQLASVWVVAAAVWPAARRHRGPARAASQ